MEQDVRAVRPRLWTREEYDKMIDTGFLASGERVELLDGEVLQMPPLKSLHATAIQLAQEAMIRAFGPGFLVRNQMPLMIDPHSEPEPDIAVVPGTARDYRDAHPSTALLVVEVSEATLLLDRGRKKVIYARAGICDYWIVNLADGCLEVYRDIEGSAYRSSYQLTPGESIAPLSAANSVIPVSDLLP
jgi:Uma2 family endonuclease